MALKFYLNQIDEQHKINVVTNSSLTQIAGSPDVGTIILEWNECKNALFPFTKLFVVDTTLDDTWSFIVSQDNVEVVKKQGTTIYLHTLTVSNSIHKLSKHLLRNTIFSQPYNYKSSYNLTRFFVGKNTYNSSGTLISSGTTNILDKWEENTYLDTTAINLKKQHITSGYVVIDPKIAIYKSIEYHPNGDVFRFPNSDYDSNWYGAEKFTNITLTFREKSTYESRSLNIGNNFNKKINIPNSIITWMQGKEIFLQLQQGDVTFLPFTDNVNIQYATSNHDYYNIVGNVGIKLALNNEYYTLWDVIDIIRKQTRKYYNGGSFDSLYNMPSKTDGGKGELLANTPAPELTFTGLNVYDAVIQTLSYIDAYPTIDENNNLSFEYLNDLSNNTIDNLVASDIKTTLNEEYFADRLVSDYQDGRDDNLITYPSHKIFKRVSANNYGIVSNDNNYYFYVDKSIDYIDSVKVHLNIFNQLGSWNDDPSTMHIEFYTKIAGDSPSITHIYKGIPNFDYIELKNAVYEKNVQGALPIDWADTSFPNQNNTIYYEKGDNKIYLGERKKGLTSSTPNIEKEPIAYAIQSCLLFSLGIGESSSCNVFDFIQKGDFYLSVDYHAITSGRVVQESTTPKVSGETYSTQSNSSVNLNKMGNAMQGLIAKLGNEQKSIMLPMTNYGSRAKVGTIWVDDNNNKWIITQVKTTFSTNADKVIVEAQFTKNFNSLSSFTRVDQEKRFYDISEKLTSKGYENITEYIYFTTQSHDNAWLNARATNIALTGKGIEGIVKNTLTGQETINFDYAVFNSKESIDDVNYTTDVYIPVHTFGSGNTLCFEMNFEHPINACDRLEYDNSRYVNSAVLYVGETGFADVVNINAYCNSSNSNYIETNYPELSITPSSSDKLLSIADYQYYKKPNEIFYLNYGLAFMPYFTKNTDDLGTPIYNVEEIYFGDEFINQNAIIRNNITETYSKTFYIYTSDTELYSIIDNKALGTSKGVATISVSINNNNHGTITATIGGLPVSCKSWCICDEDKNIYIAVNQSLTNTTQFKVSFFTSRFKKS